MSILKPEKLFIDQADEITFIIEKVKNADNNQVILVVAHNSIVFSSIISLRILSEMVHQFGKSMIIVTEDENGFQVAQRAGIIVVKKISQISSELWDQALNNQIEFTKKLNKQKLKTKKDALHLEEPALDNKEGEELYSDLDFEKESEKSEDESTQIEPQGKEKKDEISAAPVISSRSEKEEVDKPDEQSKTDRKEKENEQIVKDPTKPEKIPKIKNMDGILVMASGDIAQLAQDDKITDIKKKR